MLDEDLIEYVNEAAKLEMKYKRKERGSLQAKSYVYRSFTWKFSLPTHLLRLPSQRAKEPGTAVAVKTMKGTEAKMENLNIQQIMKELRTEMKLNLNTHQIMEELRTEIKQMLLAAMEASANQSRPR